YEIVHRRIDDDEGLARAGLAIEHAREQHARLTHDRPAGFERELQAAALEILSKPRGVVCDRGSRVGGLIGNAETAAEIELRDLQAVFAQAFDQREYEFEGIEERLGIEDLRTDVATHAFKTQRGELVGASIDSLRGSDVDAELVIAET